MNRIAVAVLFLAATVGDRVEAVERADVGRYAVALGEIIGSEGVCRIKLKGEAIALFVEANIPADEMEFTSKLNGAIALAKYQAESMSESQRSAHCTQIARVAKTFKFTD